MWSPLKLMEQAAEQAPASAAVSSPDEQLQALAAAEAEAKAKEVSSQAHPTDATGVCFQMRGGEAPLMRSQWLAYLVHVLCSRPLLSTEPLAAVGKGGCGDEGGCGEEDRGSRGEDDGGAAYIEKAQGTIGFIDKEKSNFFFRKI